MSHFRGYDQPGFEKVFRQRKKRIYKMIRQQMEFYFSDANLTKDKFLTDLLKKSIYIDLNTFLTFNRIKSLTSTINDLVNAISNSDFLVLSDDKSKVRRKTPFKRRYEEDECTIYIEDVPPTCSQDWLIEVFSHFGPVAYVSIPRHKISGKLKGFAFIEFQNVETAKKALEEFTAAGCLLPIDTPPEQLCSVKTYDGTDGNNSTIADSISVATGDNIDDIEEGECPEEVVNNIVIEGEAEMPAEAKEAVAEGPEDGECSDDEDNVPEVNIDEHVAESQPQEAEVMETIDLTSEELGAAASRKHKAHNQVFSETGEIISISDEEEGALKEPLEKRIKLDEQGNDVAPESRVDKPHKRNRKHKRREKEKLDVSTLGISVMAKTDWKRLRGMYLNMQRGNMKKIKQMIKYWSKDENATGSVSSETGLSANVANMELGEGAELPETELAAKLAEQAPKDNSFSRGVIIHIRLEIPVCDVGMFKRQVHAQGAAVGFIDCKEGDYEVFVRCLTKLDAQKFLQTAPWSDMDVLMGESEKEYWEKADRQKADKRDRKKNNVRGKDKIQNKLRKNNYFNV